VAAHSKACVCGCSLAGIAGSNLPLPTTIEHLLLYFQEHAYMPTLQSQHLSYQQIRNIYEIQLHRYIAMNSHMMIRIQSKRPEVPWPLVWKNIHTRTLPQKITTTWYVIIHDVVSTNQRLHVIQLRQTDTCDHCQQTDTLLNRYTTCTDASGIWLWTRQRIAYFLRTQTQYVPEEWLTAPAFKIYPHNGTTPRCGS
jgi:hypothetical protein